MRTSTEKPTKPKRYQRKPAALSVPNSNTPNRGENPVIAARRSRIAEFLTRGRTMREIVTQLEKDGLINPDTQKPWCLYTIKMDVDAIKCEWKAVLLRSAEDLRADIVAELDEIRRACWEGEEKDFRAILKALEQKSRILGLDAPTEIKATGEIRHIKLPSAKLSPEDFAALCAQQLAVTAPEPDGPGST